jgi:ribosome-binding factor A
LVTVTRVKVTPDLSLAPVYWTLMGDQAERKKTQKALARAASYVRHLLSTRMSLRRSPEVVFTFDQAVTAQDRVEQILQELKQEEEKRTAPHAPSTPAAPDGK